jgi:hypothetical protein
MSGISQEFINNAGYLYEEINIQQNDFLNEDSEYYDQEASELVEDIISTVSLSMVYEGYSANAVIGFLADSSEEEIIEKYLSFDENILTESNVSDEYIEEQLEILDEVVGALFRVGKALVKGAKYAKGAKGAAPLARMASGLKSAGTAAERVAKQGIKANAIVRPALSKGVQKVKDIAKGAKGALTSPTAKRIGKGLGVLGLGAAGGYMGAKLAGAGSGSKPPGSSQPSETTPAEPSSTPAAPSGSGEGSGTRTPATSAKPKPTQGNAQYGELIKKGKTKEAEKLGKEQWAKNFPELAKKVKPDGTQMGTGQSKMEKDAEELRQMQNRSKQRQGALMGGPEGSGKVDTKAADDALKAEQERQKKRMEQQNKTSVTAKESYEPYDVVLNYLLSEGHADTLEEANYIMLEMDENAICTIVEEYNDYLLAEEIEEWVNDLVDEGYDLSEYTWDDMVEYYVTEARIDAGKTDKEKREARADRNDTSGLDFFHTISRGKKKVKGRKTSYDSQGNMVRKYKTMQNDKKQVQRERDADEQRSRDKGGMSRGTWDKN